MEILLTSDEMRTLENKAIGSGRVSGIALMERAGEGVVAAVCEHWPMCNPESTPVLVLSGPGNNGGDGFVVARRLADLGHPVDVFFYGDVDRLSDDARRNYELWTSQVPARLFNLTFPQLTTEDESRVNEAFHVARPLIVIDALFGIGLTRPLTGLQALLDAHHARRARLPEQPVLTVAIDVPSGLSDAGPIDAAPTAVLQADITVTFHCLKQAHIHGLSFCGKIIVHDIGL